MEWSRCVHFSGRVCCVLYMLRRRDSRMTDMVTGCAPSRMWQRKRTYDIILRAARAFEVFQKVSQPLAIWIKRSLICF